MHGIEVRALLTKSKTTVLYFTYRYFTQYLFHIPGTGNGSAAQPLRDHGNERIALYSDMKNVYLF